jgi:hypothetical protein
MTLASDVPVVVVPLFGHVDGEGWTLGDFGVGGVLAPAAPDRVSEAYLGDSGRGRRTESGTKVFMGKSSVLRCVWVSSLRSIDAVTFYAIGLRVKTLDHRSR